MNDSPLSVNNISGNWCAVSCVFLLFCHWAKFGGCSLVNAAVFDSRKEPRGRVGCEWKDFRVRLLERHTLEAEERVRERSQLPNSIRSVSDRWRASVCGDLFQFSVTFHCESLNKLLLCEQPQPSSSLSLFLLSLSSLNWDLHLGKYFFGYSWHLISLSSHPPWLLSLLVCQ